MYLSLYRKYRPQTFSQVVGQQHVTRTLTNALAHQRIGHAYLFGGPRGTGKTTVAKLLAKALNCAHGPSSEPCNECDSCSRVASGYSVDVIEIDAASNRGIDEIRNLRESVRFAPTESRFKVYIVDEVHMLTTEAFNALLKTLEEPPAHVVFVLATTEPGRLPPTVTSRCQRFDFRRLTVDELAGQVERVAGCEGFSVTDEACRAIARLADGSSRDALSLLEQCAAFAEGGRYLSAEDVYSVLGAAADEAVDEFCAACEGNDLPAALAVVERLADDGKDLRRFLRDTLDRYRKMLLATCRATLTGRPGAAGVERHTTGAALRPGDLGVLHSATPVGGAIEILATLEAASRSALRPRVSAEVAAIRLCRHWAAVVGAPLPPSRRPEPEQAVQAAGVVEPATVQELAAAREPDWLEGQASTQEGAPGVPVGEAAAAAAEPAEDKSVWQRTMDELRRAGKAGLATCLSGEAVVGEVGPQVVIVRARAGARVLLEDRGQRQAVERALSAVLGRPVRVVLGEAAEPVAAEPVRAEAAAAQPVRAQAVTAEPATGEPVTTEAGAGVAAGKGRGGPQRSGHYARDRKLGLIVDVLGGVVLVPGTAHERGSGE